MEAILAGVGFHDLGELFEIAESFLRGGDLVVGSLPGVDEIGEEFAIAGVGIELEVVDDGPGLRIEDGSAVLLVVVRGILVDLKKRFERDEFVGAKDFQVRTGSLAHLDLFIANYGVANIFGEAFIHPNREVAEIQAEEGVSIFVIDNFVGILALGIGANDDEIALFTGEIEAGGVGVAFGLPKVGEKRFEGVFIFESEDENGLAEIGAEAGEGGVEDFADLFELGGDAAGFAFTGVAEDDEVGGANLDPVVEMVGGGERGGEKETYQEQKEGETGKKGSGKRHEIVLVGSDGEVKGEEFTVHSLRLTG